MARERPSPAACYLRRRAPSSGSLCGIGSYTGQSPGVVCGGPEESESGSSALPLGAIRRKYLWKKGVMRLLACRAQGGGIRDDEGCGRPPRRRDGDLRSPACVRRGRRIYGRERLLPGGDRGELRRSRNRRLHGDDGAGPSGHGGAWPQNVLFGGGIPGTSFTVDTLVLHGVRLHAAERACAPPRRAADPDPGRVRPLRRGGAPDRGSEPSVGVHDDVPCRRGRGRAGLPHDRAVGRGDRGDLRHVGGPDRDGDHQQRGRAGLDRRPLPLGLPDRSGGRRPFFRPIGPDGSFQVLELDVPSPAFDSYEVQDNNDAGVCFAGGNTPFPYFDVRGSVVGPAALAPTAPGRLAFVAWPAISGSRAGPGASSPP